MITITNPTIFSTNITKPQTKKPKLSSNNFKATTHTSTSAIHHSFKSKANPKADDETLSHLHPGPSIEYPQCNDHEIPPQNHSDSPKNGDEVVSQTHRDNQLSNDLLSQ
jgi:hypothetical protein